MPVNFKDLLGVQVDSAERPVNFPVGQYDAIVMNYEFGESAQKGTPFCQFNIKLTAPREDVDDDQFEAAGGMEKLNARAPLRLTFYVTDNALYRLREFLENTMELPKEGRNFDEVIPEAANLPLVVTIKHRAGQKEGEFFMEIADHAPAE